MSEGWPGAGGVVGAWLITGGAGATAAGVGAGADSSFWSRWLRSSIAFS